MQKMQFSDRQQQISDKGDIGALNFNFAAKFSQAKILYLWEKQF